MDLIAGCRATKGVAGARIDEIGGASPYTIPRPFPLQKRSYSDRTYEMRYFTPWG